MEIVEKLNIINGFDTDDLKNAKQNNYAWSMAELGDYIYVGTGRNIASSAPQVIYPGAAAPLLVKSSITDNTAEIWRYKKDGSLPWKRVYKAAEEDMIAGFRFMITHKAKNSTEALYAASFGLGNSGTIILKSTDGSNWTKVSDNLEGGSSRSMVSFNGKLYVSTIGTDAFGGEKPLLYCSEDPEFFDFKLIIDVNNKNYIKEKNPSAGITDMAVFNNKLYVTVSGDEGMEVWRTNSSAVKMNEWTLVVDKGFGDSMNSHSISVGVFKNYLYVAAIKQIPLSFIIPMGAELIRIDKNDNWQLIVGGEPIKPSKPTTGIRNKSLSGYKAGFSNPFNLYIWQLKWYNNMLLASTFDHGTNIEMLRDIVLLNKDILVEELGEPIYKMIVTIYNTILYLFNKYNYPRGFDLFTSFDGIHFKPITLNGFGNGNNYGGRILLVSKDGEDLYIGTANPYDGCEVLRTINDDLFINTVYQKDIYYFNDILKLQNKIDEMIDLLIEELRKAGKINL